MLLTGRGNSDYNSKSHARQAVYLSNGFEQRNNLFFGEVKTPEQLAVWETKVVN